MEVLGTSSGAPFYKVNISLNTLIAYFIDYRQFFDQRNIDARSPSTSQHGFSAANLLLITTKKGTSR